MPPRAFPQGVERLVRRATIVNSADDIRRVTTQCLADGTPCTLELGSNIVCSAGFTIPGGLKAFSIDGAQRFKLIVSGDLPFLFYAKGAENNDGCPVEVGNVEILVKEGSTLTTAFLLEQFSDVSPTEKRRPGLVLSNVFARAVDAGGIGSLLLQSDFLASTFRTAIVDVTNIQCRNVTHFFGDTDFLSLYVGSTFAGVSSTTTMSFGRGASSAPLVTCNIATMSGEIQVSIGDNSTASFTSCNVDSYTGNAGANTLLRMQAAPRTVGPNEVDLDNISGGGSPSSLKRTIGCVVDGGGSAITTGLKSYVRVPFDGTITGWTVMSDVVGSVVVDVWKDTFAASPPTVADSIAGTEKPTLSSAQKAEDTTLTTWTTAITAGDVLAFNVDSASTVTRVIVQLEVTVS